MTSTQLRPPDPHAAWWENRRSLLLLWLLAGTLLFGAIARLPLKRSQEARVLQTAHEMLGQHWRNWLIPHLNGRVRLEKPPLAYWLAAASYKVFGVSAPAGRLPMAITAWLTLALTYCLARWLFNPRAAFLAAAALLGCFAFYRYAPLAETDVLVTFFITAAVFAFWRAVESTPPAPPPPTPSDPASLSFNFDDTHPTATPTAISLPSALWFHAASVATALTILSKGLPGAFPLLFFLALLASTRRWHAFANFLLSGAALSLIAIASPWFLFVMHTPEWAVMKTETSIIFTGYDHKAPFWFYLPVLLKATLPFVAFVVLALIVAISHWRTNLRLHGLLLWAAVIFLPLSAVRQKQEHYLMPLLPPLMILVAWLIDRALDRSDPPLTHALRYVVLGTALASLAAIPAPLIAAHILRGSIITTDLLATALIAALVAATLLIYRVRSLPSAAFALIASGSLIIPILLGLWAPSLTPDTRQAIAKQIIQRFGDGPYAFWSTESITLSFHMRRPIPMYLNEPDFLHALARQPRLVVIFDKGKQPNQTPPGALVEQISFQDHSETIAVYRLAEPKLPPLTSPASPSTPAAAPQSMPGTLPPLEKPLSNTAPPGRP